MAARELKQRVYGNRIALFAPLYLGNMCVNNCAYCGFQNKNTRRKLCYVVILGESSRNLGVGSTWDRVFAAFRVERLRRKLRRTSAPSNSATPTRLSGRLLLRPVSHLQPLEPVSFASLSSRRRRGAISGEA